MVTDTSSAPTGDALRPGERTTAGLFHQTQELTSGPRDAA
jgi:hypothetical protein